jgi:iron(III) transport system substrate-binding protein
VLRDYEERFEAAHPEVDVQALDMGSQEIYARVRGERSRPRADVWWGGPASMFMQAADEGLLEPHRPSWAEDVPERMRGEGDLWYGVYQSPLGIVYNNRERTADEVPQTWDELLEPQWDGLITLRKPLPSGTMRTFICAAIMREGGVEQGLAWLKSLHDNLESYQESPQFLYMHMKKRPELISVWLQPDVVLQRQRNEFPLACLVPPKTPVLTEGIALVKGAPHPETARLFYEFVTSEESLAHQAKAYAKMPARNDLDPSFFPEWMREQEIQPMDLDWEVLAAHEEEWVQLWEEEVFRAR